MDTNQYRDFITAQRWGFHVSRASDTLPTIGVTESLFLVTKGRIEVTLLVGEVTVDIEGTDPVLSVTSRATTGSAVVLNSTVDLSSLETGGFVRVNGSGGALIKSNAGACLSLTVPSSFVVPVGNIALIAGATKTGEIRWDLWYFPLDEGAIVTAA